MTKGTCSRSTTVDSGIKIEIDDGRNELNYASDSGYTYRERGGYTPVTVPKVGL
ncbi:hypothetical protein RHGRI_001671 [Rhododendron griersonianum]|uniref:Uncharacterized protein n=1 Tax=Rhododendron griersonianum TaxID=479676 RepID=A0AAV6LLM5_9ERIC|nr:hypothetical protein RHGRI_001671 [Rhododendron griersonianum]